MLKASNTTKSDYFGNSVAISADRMVVGAYFEDSISPINGYEGDRSENLEANVGAAYVFGESLPLPPQEAFAKAAAAAGWTGPDSAATATPLGDGIPNLLKYASNLNLGYRDGRTLNYFWEHAGLPRVRPVTNGSATAFQVEYLRRRRSGLIYTPKLSNSLLPGSFVPLTGTPAVTPINDEWERVVIQEASDSLTSPTKFAIVEVSLP